MLKKFLLYTIFTLISLYVILTLILSYMNTIAAKTKDVDTESKNYKISDTIQYTGLTSGKRYTIKGKLKERTKVKDKITGKLKK